MKTIALLSAPLLISLSVVPAFAHDPSPASSVAAPVSQDRLRADVESLVGFGTRHTLSEQDSATRGIGAARRWAEAEFRRASEACGGCLTVVTPERMVSGNRIETPVRLVNVVAIQPGTERPDEVVIVQAHIDSRASDVMDWKSDAPGANDNASGTALVLEAARTLSQHDYPTTIVYAALSGEEQGLYGGSLMADYAREQGWTVKAVLNNDIVGGSHGSDGKTDDTHVRVFSEALRSDSNDELRSAMRRNGGENDSPSRNLSRYIAGIASADADDTLAVRQIYRADRMGRGGDQLPFQAMGYPAIRFSVAVEDYEHQHQDLRTEDGVTYGDTVQEMDFPYLAKVTRLNVETLAALAQAPMPPRVSAEAAVQTFTTVQWTPSEGATGYRIWRRRTDDAQWEMLRETDGATHMVTLDGLRGDDWIVGVSARAGEAESPVAAAVPGGAFYPLDTSEGE
ncbi:M28 family metallopeptidase [Croceicoccus sp. YJ47]|uniref:M28 family metallopeptidase n=1 Tax=Croceicoccus sp. YJ47 TaxID=2798724 RepID=UPI001921C470|nr:M28 family metallopeptidase [Croceicoccus sp. YJ47]QQN74183.1 M28 family metallopeptidase [Croceicoccus sp. YJ47]